jgi:hypothetical protein
MTTPPRYVYLCVCQNYRDPAQWYVVGASDDPMRDMRRLYNRVIARTASRRVLWCIECAHAEEVAAQVIDWLRGVDGLESAGAGIKSFLLGSEDVERVKVKTREIAFSFLSSDRTSAP